MEPPFCLRCGTPLAREEEAFCRRCRANPPAFDGGRSLYLHRDRAAKAVYDFKFKNRPVYGEILGLELAERFGAELSAWQVEAVLPVPMFPKKERKRGYNQAAVLAKAVAERRGIPLVEEALLRIRDTRPQKELDPQKRQFNLQGAFAVRRCWIPVERALLVDDIYTTGSTLDGCARMLKKAGVRKVYFLTLSIGQDL